MSISEYVKTGLKNFKNKKILIYGTGIVAKQLISTLPDYHFVGVLDRYRVSGEVEGLPVLMWDDVTENTADVLIIAAARKNIREIYERIQFQCLSKKLEVYSDKGENLIVKYWGNGFDGQAYAYCNKNIEQLKNLILNYDAISFDLFDTLIMRCVLQPRDVFDLVGERLSKQSIEIKDFNRLRIQAEQQSDGTLKGIYRSFGEMTGLDAEICDTICQEELKCEKECLLPRDVMVEVMRYAIEQGKRVNIVSDMYLPSDVLEEILTSLGIHGYEKIYVSCEYGVGKCDGLFDIYKNEVKADSYLHIGDNEKVDGDAAKLVGIDSYMIKSAYDLLRISNIRNCLVYINSVADSLLVGLLISDLFNNPFALYHTGGVVHIDYAETLINLTVMPTVLVYMQELVEVISKNTYKGILFGARDGYLFKRIYEEVFQQVYENCKVPAIYLLTSRKLCLLTTVYNRQGVEKFKDAFPGENTIVGTVNQMFGDICPFSSDTPRVDLNNYLEDNYDAIIQKGEMIRKNYYEYLKLAGIDLNARYLFCDLNGQGTVQSALNTFFNLPLNGLYLNKLLWAKEKNINRITIYEPGKWTYSIEVNDFLESIITSPDSSVCGMEEGGKPVYAEENRKPSEIDAIMQIQAGIIDSIKKYVSLYIGNARVSKELADNLLGKMKEVNWGESIKMLKKLSFIDDLMGEEHRVL